MKIEISNGELLNKLSILELKLIDIKSDSKLENIRNEYNYLYSETEFLRNILGVNELYQRLVDLNRNIWEAENDIREREVKKDFTFEFIDDARAIYFLNDEAYEIRKEINRITGSNIIEEKNYYSY